MSAEFYNFTAQNIHGKVVGMDEFRGKTILIVNTASKCGLTPQFEGLEKLYQKYKDKDFVILGFPCNQFANQEPGDEKSISEGCLLNYGVSFPMFAKIDVNGSHTHEIYTFLKKKLGGFFNRKIKWNFTKFLINSEGKPIKRFSPFTKPEKIDIYLQNKILSQ
jgi:glutathione peroxidase